MSTRARTVAAVLLAVTPLAAGCASGGEDTGASGGGGETSASTSPSSQQRYPDVADVEISPEGEGAYTLDVTLRAPYDTPERYADGWRVLGPDDEVYGEKELLHDHGGDGPFTRTQGGVEIPGEVSRVTVEGHDTENGYGGEAATVDVPSGS